MHPIKHVLLTAVLFFSLRVFFNLDFYVLFYSLALTLSIDAIDHTIAIFTFKDDLVKNTRKMIKDGDWVKAIKEYYKNRRWTFRYFYLHNLAAFFASLFVAAYFSSPILLIGIVFHYLCDMLEGWHKKDTKFWTNGWKELFRDLANAMLK